MNELIGLTLEATKYKATSAKNKEITMTEIEKLSHDTFYKMQNYSQITIDYVDELEDLLEEGENLEGFEYKLSTVLEVMNPELKYDIEAFNKMIEIVNEK